MASIFLSCATNRMYGWNLLTYTSVDMEDKHNNVTKNEFRNCNKVFLRTVKGYITLPYNYTLREFTLISSSLKDRLDFKLMKTSAQKLYWA